MPKPILWPAVALFVAAADQTSKFLISGSSLQTDGIWRINDYFDLVLAHNRGAAFSLLAGAGGWQRFLFSGIALAAIGLLSILIRRHLDQPRFCWGLSLILGGALGNLVDRIRVGTVTDFIQWHVGNHYWPAFNLADAAITVGVAVLLWDGMVTRKGQP